MGERKQDSNFNFPYTILRVHHLLYPGLSTVQGNCDWFKGMQQGRAFFSPYTKRELVQPDLSPTLTQCCRGRSGNARLRSVKKLWGIPGQWEQVADCHHSILCSGLGKLSLYLPPTAGSRRILYSEGLHITLINTSVQQQPKSFPQVLTAPHMSKTLEPQEPSSIPEGRQHSRAEWVK